MRKSPSYHSGPRNLSENLTSTFRRAIPLVLGVQLLGGCEPPQRFFTPTFSGLNPPTRSAPVYYPIPTDPEVGRVNKIKENDQRRIDARNSNRIKNKGKLAEELSNRKADLLAVLRQGGDISYTDLIFEVIERMDQGVEGPTVEAARKFLKKKSKELRSRLSKTPDIASLEIITEAFTPKVAFEITRSSVSDSLSCEVCERSQNCNARENALVAAFESLYPKYKDKLYRQQFADHTRPLVKIGNELYIFEVGNIIPLGGDEKTQNQSNIVMPYRTHLLAYVGEDFESYKDQITQYGPENTVESAGSEPYFYTDQITSSPSYSNQFNLGHFSDAEVAYTDRSVEGDDQADEEHDYKTYNLKIKSVNERILSTGEISPADARMLSRSRYFIYPNVKELSIEAAKELAHFKGYFFKLDGLTQISPEVARELAKIEGRPRISLQGLTQISHDAAKALGRFKGSLFLDGITSIDQGVAAAFGEFYGHQLSLNGLNELPPEIASGFSGQNGKMLVSSEGNQWEERRFLHLAGLRNMDPKTLKNLSHNNPWSLNLSGLPELTDELAAELGEVNDPYFDIVLNGVTHISDSQIEALKSMQIGRLAVEGLKDISSEGAEILHDRSCFISFHLLEMLPKPNKKPYRSWSDECAEVSTHYEKRDIFIPGEKETWIEFRF